MYPIDERDTLRPIEIPPMEAGSPEPRLQYGRGLILEYSLRNSGDERVRLRFEMPLCCYLGYPGEESTQTHPLASRGLRCYDAYEVVDSSWLRAFGAADRHHAMHKPERFAKRKHFIITFHDETFECIASGFVVEYLGFVPDYWK